MPSRNDIFEAFGESNAGKDLIPKTTSKDMPLTPLSTGIEGFARTNKYMSSEHPFGTPETRDQLAALLGGIAEATAPEGSSPQRLGGLTRTLAGQSATARASKKLTENIKAGESDIYKDIESSDLALADPNTLRSTAELLFGQRLEERRVTATEKQANVAERSQQFEETKFAKETYIAPDGKIYNKQTNEQVGVGYDAIAFQKEIIMAESKARQAAITAEITARSGEGMSAYEREQNERAKEALAQEKENKRSQLISDTIADAMNTLSGQAKMGLIEKEDIVTLTGQLAVLILKQAANVEAQLNGKELPYPDLETGGGVGSKSSLDQALEDFPKGSGKVR